MIAAALLLGLTTAPAVRTLEEQYWKSKKISRTSISAIRVFADGDAAVVDTNIDTDNLVLYRRVAGTWRRGPSIKTGVACELVHAGVPAARARRISMKLLREVHTDVYRTPLC